MIRNSLVALALAGLVGLATPALAGKLGADPDLLQAAKSGDVSLTHTALLRGDDPDAIDEDGHTALMRAAQYDHPEVMRLLLNGHATANRTDHEGKTALFWAAEQGDPLSIDVLIKGGANVDKDAKGVTPLMAAARTGNADVAARLLAAGADVGRLDYSGRDAIGWAQDAHDPSLVAMLRQASSKH
jgi:ankyrin repeat protein